MSTNIDNIILVEAITIVILGSICGLKNVSQIQQWAANERTRDFLKKKSGMNHAPCYYWLLCLLKLIKNESLNRCFVEWVCSFMPADAEQLTGSLDGNLVLAVLELNSAGKDGAALNIIKIASACGKDSSPQASSFSLSCAMLRTPFSPKFSTKMAQHQNKRFHLSREIEVLAYFGVVPFLAAFYVIGMFWTFNFSSYSLQCICKTAFTENRNTIPYK